MNSGSWRLTTVEFWCDGEKDGDIEVADSHCFSLCVRVYEHMATSCWP